VRVRRVRGVRVGRMGGVKGGILLLLEGLVVLNLEWWGRGKHHMALRRMGRVRGMRRGMGRMRMRRVRMRDLMGSRRGLVFLALSASSRSTFYVFKLSNANKVLSIFIKSK
jgi:hypothetical protein